MGICTKYRQNNFTCPPIRHGDYVLAYEEIAYEFDNLETITSGKKSGWLKDSFCVYILSKVACYASLYPNPRSF